MHRSALLLMWSCLQHASTLFSHSIKHSEHAYELTRYSTLQNSVLPCSGPSHRRGMSWRPREPSCASTGTTRARRLYRRYQTLTLPGVPPQPNYCKISKDLGNFHETNHPSISHHSRQATSNLFDAKLGVHILTSSTTTQASSSQRWWIRCGPTPSGTWDQHFGLLPGQVMHGTQVSPMIGHTVEHVSAHGARRQALVSLPVQDQRVPTLVHTATVLAGYRSTWGRTR